MNFKISTFIIALVLVSLFMGVFAVFLGELNDKYAYDTVSVNDSNFAVYNKLTQISNQTKDIEEQTDEINSQQNVLDVIGSMFNSGYKALQLTKDSFSLFNSMVDSAFNQIGLGETSRLFKTSIITIVLVIIVIGIILSAVIKRDL